MSAEGGVMPCTAPGLRLDHTGASQSQVRPIMGGCGIWLNALVGGAVAVDITWWVGNVLVYRPDGEPLAELR